MPWSWPAAVFLAIFGFYLDRSVNMRMVFWNQNDLFLWNLQFAREFMVAAGQPCVWLGKLLLQPCYYGWPGALAVVMVVGVMLVSAGGTFSRIAPRARLERTWMVPAVLLLVLHSQYAYGLSNTVGLTLALTGSCVYVHAASRSWWVRLALFVAISVPLYYLAGRAYFVLAGCCLVYELLTAKRRVLGLILFLVVVSVPAGIDNSLAYLNGTYLHFELPETSYLIQSQPGSWLLGALYAYFPACVLFLAAQPHIVAALDSRRQARKRLETGLSSSRPQPARTAAASAKWGDAQSAGAAERRPRFPRLRATMRGAAPYLLFVAAGVGGVKLFAPQETKKLLEIDWASNRHEWDKVLRAAAGLSPGRYADYANQEVNLALYHLGRLPYDMFSYPQWRLFVDHDFGSRGRLFSRKAFDLFLELGRVNEAEAIAHNDWEAHPSAEFLKRIALTKLIKDRPDAARVYLNVLRDDLTYGIPNGGPPAEERPPGNGGRSATSAGVLLSGDPAVVRRSGIVVRTRGPRSSANFREGCRRIRLPDQRKNRGAIPASRGDRQCGPRIRESVGPGGGHPRFGQHVFLFLCTLGKVGH